MHFAYASCKPQITNTRHAGLFFWSCSRRRASFSIVCNTTELILIAASYELSPWGPFCRKDGLGHHVMDRLVCVLFLMESVWGIRLAGDGIMKYAGVSGRRYSRTGERDRDEGEDGVSTTEMGFFFRGRIWILCVVFCCEFFFFFYFLFFLFSLFFFFGVFLI